MPIFPFLCSRGDFVALHSPSQTTVIEVTPAGARGATIGGLSSGDQRV